MKIVVALLLATGILLVSRAALCDEGRSPSPYGFGVSAGAGVTGFVDGDMRAATDPGAAWDLRVAAGTRLPVSIEAAYVGSAQAIDALGLDPDAILVGSGLEAGARIDLLPAEANPFVVVGAGWTRYQLANADRNTSSLNQRDDVLTLSLAIGMDLRIDRVVLDARAVMRPTFDNELLPDSAEPGNPTRLDSLSLLVRAGLEL